ncbi:MAG: GIY-YIG nuclease family protein [Patescibacteria group bacterium]
MYYFYVIQSDIDGSLYFGSADDLKRRFREHNSGLCKSTKNKTPWTAVYYEAYDSLKKARYREWKVKNSAHEYRKIKERIL